VDVDEMGQIDDDDDQPAFAKIPYSCAKKALILPVSNELATDNVANLFSYLGRWFAKKLVITENTMLLTALRSLTATDITSDPLAGIKTALNVGLDPAISTMAAIICNQNGFDALDQLTDDNGRPMLQPDPTNATRQNVKGRPVHVVSNAVMGNTTNGSGQTATTAADLFIGYGKEFATLFRCGSYELASTDIGGNAWRTDSTELRGIARLGVSKFDAGAMLRRSIAL
ncbi:MAG: phage major capsid protein, partial [Clostridia bacterium]|nr:phage major capsid protein [Clostridia bacterium]